MTTSENGYQIIRRFEACVLHPYLDIAGVASIGWGSTMYSNGKRVTINDAPISQAYADALLKWEVETKEKSVNAYLSKTFVTQNQFDSLVSFVYNLGVGAIDKSRLFKTVRLNPNEARSIKADDMDDLPVKEWFKANGIIAVPLITYFFSLWSKITVGGSLILSKGLIKRRLQEASLYLSK